MLKEQFYVNLLRLKIGCSPGLRLHPYVVILFFQPLPTMIPIISRICMIPFRFHLENANVIPCMSLMIPHQTSFYKATHNAPPIPRCRSIYIKLILADVFGFITMSFSPSKLKYLS